MRTIKFRAWEKKMKEMFIVDDISFEWRQVNTASAWRFFYEVELMQYTGLQDKNGVDIYEGDICYDFHLEENGVVKFDEGKFVYVEETQCYDLSEAIGDIELVGNIYENKELLE